MDHFNATSSTGSPDWWIDDTCPPATHDTYHHTNTHIPQPCPAFLPFNSVSLTHTHTIKDEKKQYLSWRQRNMIKAFVPPLSSHEPLTASKMKQSELPPAVTMPPADPESRTCNVQSYVDRSKRKKTPWKLCYCGKKFLSFFSLSSQ